MQSAKIVALLVLLGLVAVFTFQNTDPVEVTFFFWSIEMSVSLMLLSALFIGILTGMLISFLNTRIKNKKQLTEGSFKP